MSTVLYEQDGRVATITLNRPERMNTMGGDLNERMLEALQRAADAFSGQMISGEDRGAAIVLGNLGDSAVEWKVRMWVASADYWAMLEALTGEVKRQLDAVDIGIPFPQLDVHLSRVDDGIDSLQARPRMRPTRREAGLAGGVQSMPYAS